MFLEKKQHCRTDRPFKQLKVERQLSRRTISLCKWKGTTNLVKFPCIATAMNLGVCLSVSLRFLTRQLPVIWYKMIWKRKYTSHQNFYQIWHHYFGMFLSHQLSIIFQIYIGTSNLHKVINPLHLYFISNYRHIRVWFLLLGSFLHIFFHKVNRTIHASLH